MRALVIGGTRILRPLVLALAKRGDEVTVVARTRSALDELEREAAGVRGIACDYGETGRFGELLDGAGRFDVAVEYMPGAPAASVRAVAMQADTIVHVLPSAFARPGIDSAELEAAAPSGRVAARRLVLGWTQDGGWHGPQEISAAALRLLDGTEADAALGRTRPWGDRPA